MLYSYGTALIVAFVSSAIYYVYVRYQASIAAQAFCKQHGCLPIKAIPQNSMFLGYPLLRNLIKAKKAHGFMAFLQDTFEKYGPTFAFTILGNYCALTHEMENIKAILATNFEDWSIGHRDKEFSPLLGHGGIFTSDGEAWQHSRAMMRQALTRSQVADTSLFESHLRPLFDAIPRDGATVDLGPLFFAFTLDVTLDFIFGDNGEQLTEQQLKERTEFGPAFDYAQANFGKRGTGRLRYFYYFNKFWRSCRQTHLYVDRYVTKALQGAPHAVEENEKRSRYVFLNELVKETRDPAKIRAEALNILLAGRDTTASLLTIAFHILPKYPDVEKKLRHDIDQLGSELLTFEALKNLKYLRYFLNECLRLYPIVPANSRTPIRDTVLPTGGGPRGDQPAYVPKGTEMSYSVYAMHRDKAIYGADAEDFRPERWETIRPGWAYAPFNGGPRICPGQVFALTEASYTIARILQTYSRLEGRDDEAFVEKLALTMSSLNGAKVGLFMS